MRKIILALFSLIVWVLLVWPFTPWGFDYQSFLVGIIVSIFVGILFGDVFTESPHKFFEPKRYMWFICFVFVFFWEFLHASFDFAYRVLHPELPINPGIIKVKTNLKKEFAIGILANCIGFAPGAVTVEVSEDNYLYIHMAFIRHIGAEEPGAYVIRRFERILKRIFE
ncbi:MAG: Na(+)/H(+) antiporter subunit E1 [candidate division TA06 bacterium ADurb.Bin131]|uniref:Na(+)/H(+) antiporter subunit E1 n=1 Tax=candidate division TA06 bacterium ADurb.Bin131 TaxID=1852827 RepID=A0A1V6C4Y7_UNCT6|nr:MAG: Na(+)/H(+) antiporter subunit E1 [candidate division TA06 bacterium ADurb.Bin131]